MTCSKNTILLTGAAGFIGKQLRSRLETEECDLRCATRNHLPDENSVAVGDIGPETPWGEALDDINIVIHTAARNHSMIKENADALTEYRKVNVEGTLNLARQAVSAGVKRLIFISSIKVNGERTYPGVPFTAEDTPSPVDSYAISKMEAEEGLRRIATDFDIEIVIIRPPLVYGPGVKGNFHSMMNWVYKGIPLPLGAIHNLRSLIGLDNLVDFIITCIDHPAAANQTFLVSDGEDISTTDLLQRVGKAMNKQARLIPIPTVVLKMCAGLLGKKDVSRRLCNNLQLDISKAKEMLDWIPQISLDEGLKRAVGKVVHSLHT